MNETTKAIIFILTQHLEKNPKERFTQALFNLGITEFADKNDPANKDHLLRDIYNDDDTEVLERISTN